MYALKVEKYLRKPIAASALLAVLLFAAETCVWQLRGPWLAAGLVLFAALNIWPLPAGGVNRRYRICSGGGNLLTAFLMDVLPQIAAVALFAVKYNAWWTRPFWIAAAIYTGADLLVFWNGILRVYLSSPILGVKMRLLGALCGLIPVVNLFVLAKMLDLVFFDIAAEQTRRTLNEGRKAQRVCATQYPIVLVHGVFFRDSHFFNYWGRIPEELERNGARVFYGGQQSALSVPDSAAEIADRIHQVLAETGSEKVNIIAHSKGGLDSRYALTHLGLDTCVASLTTVNTPHRGCEYADWLLDSTTQRFRNNVAQTYNTALKALGDENPDFLQAVGDLRADACRKRNETTPDMPGVYYQSVFGKINKPLRNMFPLNLTHAFVTLFEGDNDGLVSWTSAEWGERCIILSTNDAQGISHVDVIDMPRHNRKEFDAPEFYVRLVTELKEMGF